MRQSIYSSISQLFDSILRGNEIEFNYQGKAYFILPERNEDSSVIGVLLGEKYRGNPAICCSEQELRSALVGELSFCEIFSDINITWQNF